MPHSPLTQTTAAAHCPTLTGRTDKAVAGGRRNTAFTPPRPSENPHFSNGSV